MRSREVPRRDGALTRCARWLGVDRNPLRRGTDRIEMILRLAIVMLLVVAVPVAAVAVGRQADHVALNRAQAQRAEDHSVKAVLLDNAQATGVPDPYTSIQTTWVRARWQPPGGPARTGEVLATAGARKGSTVPTWINASGAVASPPPDHRLIVGDVCIAVMLTCLASVLLLLVSGTLARRALDRRRMCAWEAEWRAIGPLWSGHRR
ncbi:MAG: hypothetical protein JO037_22840 [Actinobacteria bacterium]|nr:hypothetical protein [Actinomycetota bacterium]